jgi:predicted transcriptional regulator
MAPTPRAEALGALEAAVLDALWHEGESTTPEVHERVGRPRGLAYTTILTVLQRLTRKGLVARKRAGRSHVYGPALTREEFAELRGQTLASLFVQLGASGQAAFLAEAERLDPELLERLRKRVRRAR